MYFFQDGCNIINLTYFTCLFYSWTSTPFNADEVCSYTSACGFRLASMQYKTTALTKVADSGYYTCQARNSKTGEYTEKRIELSVTCSKSKSFHNESALLAKIKS